MYNRLSISTKLLLLMLFLGLSTIAVVGTRSYLNATASLQERTFDQLASIAESKAFHISEMLASLERDMLTIAELDMTRQAVSDFKEALRDSNAVGELPQNWEEALRTHYQDTHLVSLKSLGLDQSIEMLWPPSELTRRIQYLYVAENPHPFEDRDLLTDAGDGGAYSRVHARYQFRFDTLAHRFGFEDILLVEPENGTIIFSTQKHVDFLTSLHDGPYADSNLGRVVRRAAKTTPDKPVVIEDIEFYSPAREEPVGFLAAPIRRDQTLLGILVAELPQHAIDRVMTVDGDWQSIGLGDSGESYLVGSDSLLRSQSRFYLEDPEGYLALDLTLDKDAHVTDKIRRHGTTVLLQSVQSPSVREALAGNSGTRKDLDYRNVRVLQAYTPIDHGDLDWVLLSEIDEEEAFAPIRKFTRELLIETAAIALLSMVLAFVLARFFVRPILALITATRQFGDGALDVRVNFYTKDELGELSSSFNDMAEDIQERTETIVSRTREKEQLLDFIRDVFGRYMSEEVATNLLESPERVQPGGEDRDVTVLLSDLKGYSTISERMPPNEVVDFLNDYLSEMNDVIDAHGGVVLEYLGDGILAVFNAPNDLSDHPEQAVRCAIAMRERLEQINTEWDQSGRSETWKRHGMSALVQRVGLHSGHVVAGNLGNEKRMKYSVIGDTVNVSARLEALNKETGTTILATDALVKRLPSSLQAQATSQGAHTVKGRGQPVEVYSF